MKLQKASTESIKYAILNFHYSKVLPMVQIAYSVFNSQNEWCGIIAYSIGANKRIGSQYDLKQGQIVELIRVALNGKQECTSKAIAISLKLLKKDCPLVKLVVSYADSSQQHIGTIYQATNWHYVGISLKSGFRHKVTKKPIHSRSYYDFSEKRKSEYEKVNAKPKYKYIFPIDKSLLDMCKSISKPYPKKES